MPQKPQRNCKFMNSASACVQWHTLKLNTLPPVIISTQYRVYVQYVQYTVCGEGGGCRVVLETIYNIFSTVGLLRSVFDQIQSLEHFPRQNLRRKISCCRKALFHVTCKTKKFCIAFYESYPSTY